MSLKKKSINGFLWDAGGTFFRQGIGFVISIFLARLLDPAEFGVVGMAMVFIAVFNVFANFGFASALIQNQENTSVTYSSVFYLNVFMGVLLFFLMQIAAPYVGAFYDNDQVTGLLRWLAFIFIFSSFNIVQQTIFARNIDFRTLSIRTAITNTASGVVGVIMAFRGYGAFALVGQQLSMHLMNTVVLWKVTEWKPKWEFSFAEIKKLFGFSAFRFLDNVGGTIFQNINTLYIGKLFSPALLGFYSRAVSLNRLLVQNISSSINKVTYPVMSAIREDNERFCTNYKKIVSLVSFLTFFGTGLLLIWGDTLIIGLFGAKWAPSIPIYRILVLVAFAYPVNQIILNAFLSKGRAREGFYVGMLRRFIKLIPLGIGYFWGFDAFLYTFTFSAFITTLINIYFTLNFIEIKFLDQVYRVFIPSLPVLILYFLMHAGLLQQGILFDLVYSVLFIAFFFLYSFLLKLEGLKLIQEESGPWLKKVKTQFS